jgi:hypothetical protein
MSFWNIFGKMAVSDEGETIQKVSDTFSVSSEGVAFLQTCRHFSYRSLTLPLELISAFWLCRPPACRGPE